MIKHYSLSLLLSLFVVILRLMLVGSLPQLHAFLDDLHPEKCRLRLLNEFYSQRHCLFVAVQCLVVLAGIQELKLMLKIRGYLTLE